ncbi:DNA glycosylase [Aspergillus ellipticus CBS 707.79]|uniref:Endonuclease III homolog n=1 Tax=Aspergillus ellipticus CBS 707.79 TaxID=1448320 RepID=A0A319DN26_9EURO|nr:DNA glycosylase [Aspergillus ellipticus CBS 707.79]
MRTSRTSKETAKVMQALSPPARRHTRSQASVLRSFAYNRPAPESQLSDDDTSSLSSVPTDIEDILEPPAKRRALRSSARTRSGGAAIKSEPVTRIKRETVIKREPVETRTSEAAEPVVKHETVIKDEPVETPLETTAKEPASKPKTAKKPPRRPARKVKDENGIKIEPPSNWDTMYAMVQKMREANPTAPVDTMGCAELYWRASSPRDRRFQTLIALMLSSQTKDTVTAVAMQRLHTELDQAASVKKEPAEYDWKPTAQIKDSTLNLDNMLAVTPERLNELIRTVGFHNNKTKYIKAAALILRDQFDSDIPSTATELMTLPGVGPKMAFLCMSAAWGKHEGIGVDVHVHRITNLWGWHQTKTPEETRMALESWLPKDKWHEINKLLVGLGQTVCLPVGRRCGECDLGGTGLCKSEIKALVKARRPVTAKQEVSDDGPRVKVEHD